MKIVEQIKDWYLTKRTGKAREHREWESWYDHNVVYCAGTIENMFMNFKYIIEVNPDKFFQFDPFAWVPSENAKQYFWPSRPLGENCVWRYERVTKNQWDGRLHIDELGGADTVFVATNNERDAMMIALKYGG